MVRKTFSNNLLILALALMFITINVQAEAIDLSAPCALNTSSIENPEKPNLNNNDPIITSEKPVSKKTSTKSNKFGIFKLLIPGTLK